MKITQYMIDCEARRLAKRAGHRTRSTNLLRWPDMKPPQRFWTKFRAEARANLRLAARGGR